MRFATRAALGDIVGATELAEDYRYSVALGGVGVLVDLLHDMEEETDRCCSQCGATLEETPEVDSP